MPDTEQNTHHCPVCGDPFKPDDLCATDIELGICHAACLEGSPVVDLETGEPSEGPITTYVYSEDPMPDTNTQGVALEQRLRALALNHAPMQRATAEWQAADLIAELQAKVERLERENETYRTAFDGIEPVAQEGREAVAWRTRGMNARGTWMPWQMVSEEVADRWRRDPSFKNGRRQIEPLYASPQPTEGEPSDAKVERARKAADDALWKWRGLGERKDGEGLDGMHFIVRAALLAAKSKGGQADG